MTSLVPTGKTGPWKRKLTRYTGKKGIKAQSKERYILREKDKLSENEKGPDHPSISKGEEPKRQDPPQSACLKGGDVQ